MDLNETLKKQQEGNQNTYELLDQDDVLNYKHVSENQISAMMLTKNKTTFVIKFSTHDKDVALNI